MHNFTHFLLGIVFLWALPLSVQDHVLETLQSLINTADYDEIAPRVSKDGTKLYFTRVGYPEFEKTLIKDGQDISSQLSEQEYIIQLQKIYSIIAGAPVSDPIRSSFNQDIWVAQAIDGRFEKIYHPGYPLNNALPNSISSLGRNDDEMIVINQFIEGGGMKKGFSKSFKKENGDWTFPQGININNYHNSGSDVNLTMSSDGQVIILAMERSDAVGRSDLYVSFRKGGNNWSTPKNLGPGVNSPWREGTPHLSADGKTLYFSSDRGYQSDGGSDIFMQERLSDGWDKWSAPKRFRKPINSKAHDSHPYFCKATGHLYFNSTRNGSNDIFRIQIKEAKPVAIPSPLIAEAIPNISTEETILKINKRPILSKITNSVASLSNKKIITIAQQLEDIPSIEEVEIGTKVEMEAIYFKKSTAQVLHSSYIALDQLSRFLEKHPTLSIRISGHTDNRGEETALLKLSEDRANAIKRFLVVKKHIAADRIETIGFGGHLPISENVSEKGRRKNRRVAIEIIKIGSQSFGMQE